MDPRTEIIFYFDAAEKSVSDEFEVCMQSYAPIKKEGSRKAIVFVHGLLAKLSDYRGLCELLIERAGSEVDFYPFRFLGGKWSDRLSPQDPKVVAKCLQEEIRTLVSDYEQIILIGHSVGTMLLRQAIVNEAKNINPVKNEPNWLGKVERVILLSATQRGFRITKPLDQLLLFTLRRWVWLLAILVVALLPVFGVMSHQPIWIGLMEAGLILLAINLPHRILLWRNLFVESILAGSDWLDELRTSWSNLDEGAIPFRIFHVRGEADHLVNEKDNSGLLKCSLSRELVVEKAGHHEMKLTPRRGANAGDLERINAAKPGIEQALTDCFAD